jgi:hypothetical protein
MAATGDVLEVILGGSCLGTVFYNISFYRIENNPTPGVLQGLATEFDRTVVAAYKDFAHTGMTFGSVTVRNLFSEEEYTRTNLDNPQGVRDGADPLPPFVGATILLRRANRVVRAGRKHVVGGLESFTASGYWTSYALGLLVPLAAAFAADLNPGLVDLLRPVIVGRVQVAPGRYRLPQSAAEMGDRWSYVSGVSINKRVSTQNSRKERAVY